jgi:hypothetical protein
MARFWLATFEQTPGRARTPLPPPVQQTPQPYAPLVSTEDLALAVEVIEDDGEYAVLFSVVDDPKDPKEFTCRIGFANGAKSCNVWSDRGFPLLDAAIEAKGNGITVYSPCFGKDPAMQYGQETVLVATLPTIAPAPDSDLLRETKYEQALRTPDIASPATHIGSVAITWLPQKRSDVTKFEHPPSTFKVNASRYFDLTPFPQKPTPPIGFWSGNIELPVWTNRRVSRAKLVTASRSDTFGVAAFEFEDVEVLGFRIDPRRINPGRRDLGKLSELVTPLNFHRCLSANKFSAVTRSAVSDFEFRATTYTVMIELLRYGKMKLKTAAQPLTTADFQSQHEFLARMLVGRVDDDTAQAREPATFVPAIFVDNPWSKSLGRNVQGFDKRMASFFVGKKGEQQPLRPDGRVAPDEKQLRPLGSITEIALTDKTGRKPGATLIDLVCPPEADDDSAFETVDPRLALGPVSIAPMGWLQTDFDQAEYRRAFARSAVKDRFKEFSSIQVSPVGPTGLREQLEKQTTWITGAMKFVHNVQLAQPNGTVSLTFHTDPSAPKAWNDLCKLFGIDEYGISHVIMPAGSWYRMRCSLNLTIKNGLD